MTDLLLVNIGILVVIAVASYISFRSYARFAAGARGPHSLSLPRGTTTTTLDTLFDPAEAANPGKQGLFNLLDGREAFAVRSLSAQNAGRSLDIISYIWATDTTGWLLIADLIAAADRGVRVRLLLDDVNVQGFDPVFLGLAMHPNIDVRLFNPIRGRGHRIRRAVEFVIGLARFNRRIHSKAWIADGRLAIIGGRNIGDVYFSASGGDGQDAADADVVLVGPQVAKVATVFDTYWNLGMSLPILTLWPSLRINMRGFRRRLARHVSDRGGRAYRDVTLGPHSPQSLLADRLRWTDKAEVIADPPEKVLGQHSGPWLSHRIDDLMRAATQEVRLITPYFVPGHAGMDLLAAMRRRGVDVSLLTNSQATTDHSLVHGAYSFYRKPLLAIGVRLHEYAPQLDARRNRNMLHSKIFLFDDRQALIGSPNFDLRSANLNIELGLLFEQPELLAELVQKFKSQTTAEASFSVVDNGGRLNWVQTRDGQTTTLHAEPEASLFRMATAALMRIVPHALF